MRKKNIWFSSVITFVALVAVGVAIAANSQAIFAHAGNSVAPAAQPNAPAVAAASLAPVDAAILGTCTAAIHDRYTLVGPDGQVYRTWHPQVVPLDPSNPSAGSCRFAHEHGDDPATSVANPHMPAFGYIGAQVADVEPHEGFKVFVVNAGTTNNEGGTAQNSTRLVFHQGTGGAKRFDTRFHSMMFDLVGPNGFYAHVQGMADSGNVGSICANPRQGRTVVMTTGCSLTSLYEIWALSFNAGNRLTVNASVGVFDPITVLNPNSLPDQRPLIYASQAFPQFGSAERGCDRESYAGPIYWYNQNGPTTFYTDAYGHLASSGLQQQVSATSAIGIRMSSIDFYQMKLRRSQCALGLGLKN